MSPVTASGDAVRVVLTTFPDEESARRVGRTLVEERLAACANVVPGVVSIYRWEGAVETAEERLVLLKTRAALVERLAERLVALHPYAVPEVLSLEVDRGAAAYLRWVADETVVEESDGAG